MRALILLECLAILALAALILAPGRLPGVPGPNTAEESPVFPASKFLADAVPGESVTYRVDRGESTLEFRVDKADRGGPQGPPKVTITHEYRDRAGREIPEAEPTYVHLLAEHGLFPFLTPELPRAYDRVWILRKITRDELPWLGRRLPCWRVECIDPALDPNQELVTVWMHEDVPVYGILQFERAGHLYECTSWRPKS
jgi:hypothetical protein